ncbi:SNF-related serine/threonine-protein kinase [Hetaerina americana]|uniref:SNF-related serine/threonine-protein kinase n=1 Tax=Hetaerina americana TaxID=62018 RepID=UPI003A7F0F38
MGGHRGGPQPPHGATAATVAPGGPGGGGSGGLIASYDGKIAGLYDLEETLGRGHFAVVKLARHVFTGEKVAVKVIDKGKLDEVSRAHLFQEVRCMKLVQHPNVVRLYEVIDTQTKLYLVLELADGGDLYDLIMRHDGGLPDHVAREHFRQIVRAISYCHQLHVVHRDLKPENVVFFEKLGVVKLTDFGFSNRFCPGQKLETSCGSLAYSAPEILLGDSYDAPAVDVWSLGVILYMLVCGTAPFQEANDSETLTMIMDCKFTVPNHVSLPCKRLIQRMLIREPERRATLEEIASDPWLCEGDVEGGGDGSGTAAADFLPLISREHVSEEDHALIIQKMVNGKIAAKEEILEALDKNEYNHVTATYFLLAERKLRAHRQEQQRLQQGGVAPFAPNKRAPQFHHHQGNQGTGVVVSATAPGGQNRVHHFGTPHPPRPVSAGYTQGTPRPAPRLSPHLPSLIVSGKTYGNEGLESSLIEDKAEEDNTTLKVSQTHLSVPRTPLEVPQSYRARKCSIVQEEEDEDDISSPGRDDGHGNHGGAGGSGSLNRRGSRSEGRLNVAVQERLAMAPPPPAPSTTSTTSSTTSASPASRKQGEGAKASYAPCKPQSPCPQKRPLVEPPRPTRPRVLSPTTTTTVLTASSTVAIPPRPVSAAPPAPRYRSLPSPTRPLHAVCSSPQLTLNEIFEEGSEQVQGGGGGPRPPPPPPVQRSYHRPGGAKLGPSQQQRHASPEARGAPAATDVGRGSGFERRQRMHKARTASCSSSDASDEDSESRKKRAHKLKSLPPKRDSHDDSSDSQDPGGGGGGTGGGGNSNGGGGDEGGGGGGGGRSGPDPPGGHHHDGSGGGGRRHNSSGGHHHPFRRRSAGGGAGETRLRESQSLNRITEVQEGAESVTPPPVSRAAALTAAAPPEGGGANPDDSPRSRSTSIGVRLFGGWRRPQSSGAAIGASETDEGRNAAPAAGVGSQAGGGEKSVLVVPSPAERGVIAGDGTCRPPVRKSGEGEEEGEGKENRRVRNSWSAGGGGEYGGKARLARYFRLHRKLWLPGLLRGRLYKAQSCGSIRDRVRSAPPPAGVVGASEKHCRVMNGGSATLGKAKKAASSEAVDGTVQPCSDINRNMGKGGKVGVVSGPVGLAVALPCPCHGLDSSECCSLC